uniref:BAH domain-containing protein n=1 Tax=Schistocephalus solidus TaxID=70667 RepID=A0A183TH31_SCHSO
LLDESEEGRTDLKGDLMPPDGVQTALATLLYRLLNHPDLEQNDTKARLVAPLISTPDPLRHPDFYRYACSTGALASLEAALGLPLGHSLQADILLTVSPCYCLTNGYAGQRSVPAPFQHLCPEYPPICLRSLLHSVLSGKLMSTAEGDSASSPLTPATAFQRLDLAFDLLMRLWESFAGRRSWLGRRLLQIRTAYTRLRTEQAAEDSSIPLPNLTPGSAFGTTKVQGASPVSGPPKKKVDRKTLERGAEVIRCLCGFRVEAGHVMVQCDCCTTWQHLPCVWWALSLCLEPSLAAPRSTPSSQLPNWLPHRPPLDPDCEADEDTAADPAARRARCRAALLAALLTGRISLPAHSGGGGGGSAGSTAVSDCAYFCPICLELDGLTKDYPRTLAVALAQNDVTKVFPETTSEATTGVTYEYWSLASPDGGDQLLTDEFALVHRDDFRHAVERGSVVAATASVIEQKDSTHELRLASDVVVLRIYRLWKDSSGNSWMEGGAFLRPYDLLDGAHPQTTALVNSQLWHARELVYDEASRVVLPLSAWRGRCSVLSPTVYRQGRLMDLPALILPSSPVDNSSKEVEETDAHPLVFLCDRLFNRGEGDSLSFQEIAPAYLKVNMKPYAFLRHTESSTLRAAIVRQLRAEDLRTLDSTTAFGAVLSVNLDGLYSQSRERRQKGRQAPLSPLRTKELVFSLSEKRTLTTALKRLSSLPRKQLTVITENRVFTHTSRRPCSPVKLKCPPICHPNSCVGTSEALSSSVKPTSEQCSTQIPLATQEADMATSTAFPPTHPAVVVPSTKRSGKSKVGASKIREQDILKEAKTLTFIELQEKIAAQEGLSAKTASPHPRRKAVGKQHNNISTTTVKSAFKHATAVASASVPTESTQSNISSPLFVETAPPPAAATATEMAKKPQFSPISPATSPFSPDPISSAVAVVSDIVQQQQQRRLPASHESVSPASQSPQELPSTESLPLGARLLSPTEAITLDKPLEESVSEFSEDEPSSSATSGSVVVATAVETACHNAACSEVMLATSSPLNPIPLKVNQALVMTSSEEADFETCDERFSLPEPQLVAIQEEGNDDLAEDGDVQHACTHLSAGVMVSTAGSVSVVTCMPVVSHMAEASRIPCSVMTLEISPPLETLEGLDVMEVNEEFPQRTVCPHSNAFSTVCEMVLNSPFSTTDVALRSLSDIPSPSEVTSLVVTSPSDFVARTSSTVVYTCPLASSLAPGRCVSSPDRHQHRSPPPLISPAFSYQPISPDSSDESPCSAHATAQPLQIEAPNAVSDGTAHLEDNRLLTAGTEEEKRRQRHSTSRSSPSAAWSPTQCRDHKDRRRHSHHRSHHHFRDRDHHCRSSSNRSRSNSEHQQSLEHHQHRHYHRHQHHHSDCSSVESEHREHRERQRSRSQSDHRHSRHERCPEAKDATVSSIAAAENASRPNSHHRRRKGHSPKRIVFRRYEDGTGATSTRGSVVPTQEGVLDLSTSSSSTLAPESNGGGGGGGESGQTTPPGRECWLLLLQTCAKYRLLLPNAIFGFLTREKAIMTHPLSQPWQLLEYVLIQRRDRQDVLVTKAIRDTDHQDETPISTPPNALR